MTSTDTTAGDLNPQNQFNNFKKEIIDLIKSQLQPQHSNRFVTGKELSEITGIKSYTGLQNNFGQFSKKVGSKLLFDLAAVTEFLKKK